MLRNADIRRAADRWAEAGAAAAHTDQVGVYLTDEIFLYRVVDVMVTGSGEMAELEDCYWLDVVRVPMGDLLARRLRVVTPAYARARQSGSTQAQAAAACGGATASDSP